jgi:hypothetical protein
MDNNIKNNYMINHSIESEDSKHHWLHFTTKEKRVLDLYTVKLDTNNTNKKYLESEINNGLKPDITFHMMFVELTITDKEINDAIILEQPFISLFEIIVKRELSNEKYNCFPIKFIENDAYIYNETHKFVKLEKKELIYELNIIKHAIISKLHSWKQNNCTLIKSNDHMEKLYFKSLKSISSIDFTTNHVFIKNVLLCFRRLV